MDAADIGAIVGEAVFLRRLWTGLEIYAVCDDATERWAMALVPPGALTRYCVHERRRAAGTQHRYAGGLLVVRHDRRRDVYIGPPTMKKPSDPIRVPWWWQRMRLRQEKRERARQQAQAPIHDYAEAQKQRAELGKT